MSRLMEAVVATRLHECRDNKESGAESNLTGIRARLEDERGENLTATWTSRLDL